MSVAKGLIPCHLQVLAELQISSTFSQWAAPCSQTLVVFETGSQLLPHCSVSLPKSPSSLGDREAPRGLPARVKEFTSPGYR